MLKDDALNQFVFLMKFRNLSQNTITMYEFYISRFIDFIQKDDISSFDLKDAQNFVLMMKERGDNPQSINVVICAIRYFYETVLDMPLLRRQFPNIRYTEKDPLLFTKDQIISLLDNAFDVKTRVLLLLGIDCGFRAREVVNLRISDIHSDTMTISINNSKRNKSRLVKLSPACLDALRTYWKVYKPKDYFFPSRDGSSHAHVACVHYHFRTYLKQFSFYSDDFHYHSLRHTFATNMLENGCDVFLLKKLLGHSSFSSTARYIHMTTGDIQNTVSLSQVWGLR